MNGIQEGHCNGSHVYVTAINREYSIPGDPTPIPVCTQSDENCRYRLGKVTGTDGKTYDVCSKARN